MAASPISSGRRSTFGQIGASVFGWSAVLLLIAPVIVIVLVSFNPEFMVFPPDGFSLRWYRELPQADNFIRAFRLSLELAAIAALVSTVAGLLAAVALVRYEFKGKAVLTILLMSPLLVPAVIVALAVYQYLIALGVGRSFVALLVGHVVITMPFPVRTIMATLHGLDPGLEEAATVLGESPLRTFFKITLPLAKTGILAGALLSFLISWNTFPVSVFLGSAELAPLPVEIFTYLQWQFRPLVAAVSAVAILLSLVAVFLVERFGGLSTLIR